MGANLPFGRNKSAKNIYIESATLTGKPLRIPVARHDEIVAATSPKLEGAYPTASDWSTNFQKTSDLQFEIP
jgi:hypothetical protein